MKVSKTAIFLFELMVVILIFSIATAICTNIFGRAYDVSEKSKALTMAVINAESIAEEFKVGEMKSAEGIYDFFDIPDDILKSYSAYGPENVSGSAIVYLDGEWKAAENIKGTAVYAVSVKTTRLGEMNTMSIWIGSVNPVGKENEASPYEEVYSLKVGSYAE